MLGEDNALKHGTILCTYTPLEAILIAVRKELIPCQWDFQGPQIMGPLGPHTIP